MQVRLDVDYWVVDRDGELVSADPLVDAAGRASMSRGSVESLLTIETPFTTADDRRRALTEELRTACETATTLDCRLVPLATPINSGDSPDDRQHDSSDAALAASAGARIHIDADAVLEQWNTLLALTPALALVSSAPYRRGNRVANSARAHSYRTHGSPAGTRALEYADSIGALPTSDTPDEWPIALHRTRDSNGSSDSTTLEWLLPDTSLPSQLLRLVADVECVLEQAARGHVRVGRYATARRSRAAGDTDDITVGHVTNTEVALPRAALIETLTETAIDIGLDATEVADYLERMGFAVDSSHPIASRIDGRQYVTQADAQELRLEYAGRLEEDVRDLSRGGTQ